MFEGWGETKYRPTSAGELDVWSDRTVPRMLERGCLDGQQDHGL